MKKLMFALVALTVAAPAFAISVDGFSTHAEEGVSFDLPANFVEEVMFSGDEKTFDKNIHFTSIYGINWCMNLVFTTPTFAVLDGNITGTICDSGYWSPTGMVKSGPTYTVYYDHVGTGSCADSMCMVGVKSGPNITANYGWNGGCDSFPADGLINGC